MAVTCLSPLSGYLFFGHFPLNCTEVQFTYKCAHSLEMFDSSMNFDKYSHHSIDFLKNETYRPNYLLLFPLPLQTQRLAVALAPKGL